MSDILLEALGSLPCEMVAEALTHVSYANERGESVRANERLEFLGDAVLYLAAGDLLFERYPDTPEGDLTRMRAAVVSGTNLAAVALEARLGERLRLGRGEESSGGRTRPRILAGALEAVVGAVYLTRGWDTARLLVKALLLDGVTAHEGKAPATVPVDAKTRVQESIQRTPGKTLEYRVVKVEGPDHSPWYTVACVVDGVEMSKGSGSSKKEAEEAAAEDLLKRTSAG